jgi:hypothetical protein
MGLLTQALAGGIGAGADTAAGMMINNELEQARATREANLARLRHQFDMEKVGAENQFHREQTDTAYGRQLSQYVDPDTGAPLENRESQARQQELTTAQQDGPPAPGTKGLISAAQHKESTTFEPDLRDENGNIITRQQALAANARGDKLSSSKEAAAELKAENAVKLKEIETASREKTMALQLEFNQKKLDLQAEFIAARIEHLKALDAKGNGDSLRALLLQQKENESQRKAATEQAKMLTDAGGSISNFSEDQLKVYRKLEKQAGGDPGSIPVAPPPKPEKKKPAGVIGAVKEFFSGDPAMAAPQESPARPATTAPTVKPKGITRDQLESEAAAATIKVNQNPNLTQAQKNDKIRAINARRNQLLTGL